MVMDLLFSRRSAAGQTYVLFLHTNHKLAWSLIEGNEVVCFFSLDVL